jgi:uncharacterized membrane protein YccC
MFKFLVMPSLDGFVLLSASMAPFLVAGAYLATRPKLAGLGTGFLIFFSYVTAPVNPMQFNPVDALNDGVANILGVAVAGVMFGTLIPATGPWLKRRAARQLRHQVVRASFNPLEGLMHRFESGTRDLLHKQVAGQRVQDEEDRLQFAWMFSVIEIGRAVIHLRQDARALRISQPLAAVVQDTISSIARLFSRPSAQLRKAALGCVANAIETIHAEMAAAAHGGTSRDILHRMLTSLHLIRSALLDEETVLAAAVAGRSAAHRGDILHAP